MNDFIYHIPTKVYFGDQNMDQLGPEAARLGKKVLLVYGGGSVKKSGLYDSITGQLSRAGVQVLELGGVDPNPRVASASAGAALCRREGVEAVLAVGGGSVIDCAKLIAAAALYDGDAWDLVCGKAAVSAALPILAVLTLSATGSEMDTCAVISNPDTREKLAFFSPHVRPQVAFLNPALTYSVSRFQTASGSADILSHVMEVYFNPKPDLELLDREMEGMMKTVIKYAPIALEHPDDYDARANLMWTSSWAINGFINGGKNQPWSCHAMEHELSAFYDIAHGLGLAILTPRWMEYVLDENTAPRFHTFGVNVFGVDPALAPMEAARESIRCVRDFLYGRLGLAGTLSEIGIDESNFAAMAEKACGGSVLAGFKPLNSEDIVRIYQMCL